MVSVLYQIHTVVGHSFVSWLEEWNVSKGSEQGWALQSWISSPNCHKGWPNWTQVPWNVHANSAFRVYLVHPLHFPDGGNWGLKRDRDLPAKEQGNVKAETLLGYLFNKHCLSTCQGPGTVLGVGDTGENNPSPLGVVLPHSCHSRGCVVWDQVVRRDILGGEARTAHWSQKPC